ncbi:sugar ABC transporter ATP-binding protein [Kaistia dalseonensis]|uniref:ABC-type sugar transport system ATPase subunit n=1 Tax=Kaistia dalseonensis TaxID=410840 RepID=A0ABU0H5Q8_9HYPH|nr:sugar ABC transporter ATP-binding protein [Kaistia dalseonensis]MCX5495063.1 sugar ABC transporter ATP-binding protein [Kaistia dalseonensis]MDQ0437645.1 ABC-type sugar transport system ATPase subunit [Kaistia dalseonensis]
MTEASGTGPFLALSGLIRHFGATKALDGADLVIEAGSVHALVGENGAGKSTLIKTLSGLYQPGGGSIRLDGADIAIDGPKAAEALGFRFIHQELNLVPHFDAVGNAWIGRRHPRRGPFLDHRAMRRRVAEIAARIAPDLPLDRPAIRLTPGQRQMAEIVRALIEPARLVVMDEPTSSLSEGEAERLHKVVRRLAEEGTAVLFISHRLDEVLELCGSYTVLRNGRTVGAGPIAGIDRAGLVALMSGGASDHAAVDPMRDRSAPPAGRSERPGALFSADLAFGPANARFTLEARPGEIIGLYGLVGSGRSSLLKILWGASVARGTITIAGRKLVGGPADRIRKGIAYVPEDRRREGFAATLSIEDNLALAHLADFRAVAAVPISSRGKIRQFAAGVGARLRLVAARLDRSPMTLSGGNQQKLVFGRWLGRTIRVLLVDEPTRGVDVGAKAEIHAEMRRIAAESASVIMATSDIEELLALSDRVLVLQTGRLIAELGGTTLTRSAVVAAAFGHAPSPSGPAVPRPSEEFIA